MESEFRVYTYKNGDKYTGFWLNDKPHFYGTMNFSNGDEY